MVPTHLALAIGSLAQTNNQPAVPGAKADESTTTQTPGGPSGASGPTGSSTGTGNAFPLWLILLPLVVLVLMNALTGNKKQQKQRAAMLSALARNDRVLTTGGIIGTVIELYDQEMVLRVDESSNTKIRFARSAVQQVLRESKDGARSDLEVKPNAEPANSR